MDWAKPKILENVLLAPLTTLKVGGPARFFVEAKTIEDVVAAVRYAGDERLDLFILGGGSNILVSDLGFDGLVVQVSLKGITAEKPNDSNPKQIVTAQAGENWDDFVAYCVANELAGVECLSGIPGFVGGTPVQNVGAYGQEVSETIVSVRCFDREKLEIVDLSNKACSFSYRKSIFNSTLRDRYVVLSVSYALSKAGKPKIVYKDLIEHFAGAEPTIVETREAVLKIRAAKSMVIDPSDPNSQSAGSFFKNPIVNKAKLAEIAEKAKADNVPHFDAGADQVKIPAAWLIEKSGFQKGFSLGNAGISTRHSLALVNRGGATSTEIVALKDLITQAVQSGFDIRLLPEPIFVGSFK